MEQEMIKFKPITDMMLEAEENEQQKRTARKARKLAERDMGTLVIRLDDGHYEVDLERINTPADFVMWLTHLGEKNWFSPQMQADFIDEMFIVLSMAGINTHQWEGEPDWHKAQANRVK